MKALFHTGLSRILIALAVTAGVWVHDGLAAAVRWEVLPDRDRVTVSLNKEEGFAGGVTRIAPKGLLLDLGVAVTGMGQELAPENARFFRMSEPRGQALAFFMKTAAFGYVVTRPDPSTIIINAFADPLGERWTPEGLAPEPQPEPAGQQGIQPASRDAATASPDSAPEAADAPGVVRGRIEIPAPGKFSRSGQGDSAPATPLSGTEPATVRPARTKGPETPSGPGPLALSPSPVGPGNTVFRSRINPGSLSDWDGMLLRESSGSPVAGVFPEESARRDDAQAPGGPSDQEGAAHAEKAIEEPPAKIYVDKDGNPVPPPPDPVETLAAARQDILIGNYKGALEKIAPLLVHPELTSAQMEDVLHLNAEMVFMANQDKLAESYDSIVSATITAMNYNPKSLRNPSALLRLGYLNLKVGNTIEANVYFNRLRREYPMDENIPLTYYYWGEHYFSRNEMQKAADEFQYIVSNFSQSRFTRDAALGLARSYAALGYYQEAYDIIDYIERRWPRLYLESPAVLELMGDVGYRLGNLDFALGKYLTYYNLMPSGPNADVILTRIGDVYARKRQLAAAKTAYTLAETRFPDRDGGLVAMMRLAETGINDVPEIQAMVSVFQREGTSNFRTVDIYRKIINEHPDSDLVPLAMLKLAMWYLANTRYEDALRQCTALVERFPGHELAERAEEVAMRAFTALAAEGTVSNRPGHVLANWRDNPLIQKQREGLLPESRLALAMSMYKENDPEGALEMIGPLFLGAKNKDIGEQALLLALAIDLDYDRWESIERRGEQVALWELTPRTREQLEYALALARENMGKSGEAAALWAKVAETGQLDEKQQAYAEYFMARDAENERRLQDAYTLGRSALNRFLTLAQNDPEHADTGKIDSLLSSLMDISETSGRFAEALDYANRYMANLPADSAQRQGLLFRIAGIYRKQGNTPEWRKTLQELAEKYPDSVHGRAAASTLRSSQLTEDAAQFAPGGNL